MKRLLLAGCATLCLAALSAGCVEDKRHVGWDRERLILGPVALKDRVAYIDSARDQVTVIDMSEGTPRVNRYTIGRRAIFATTFTTPEKQYLAVVTRGEEAVVTGQVDEDPKLWIIDTAVRGSKPVAYDIGSPFDRLAVASDGNTAVAYFSSAGPDSEGFFRNPNELALIKLSEEPSDINPTLKTVRSFGSVPDGIVLSPPMVIPGATDPTPRVFAFVLALNNITIIDATYPARNEVSIRLDSAGVNVRPREIVFAPNSSSAYLRSDNARDVLEILLNYDPPGTQDPNDNDFRPALAELGAGAGPADIAVYDDIASRRLILAATPGTKQIVVIDTDTAQFTTIETPDPIDRVLLFPNNAAETPRVALLASLGNRLPRVHMVSLEGIGDPLVRPVVTTINLEQPVLDVVPIPGRELAMIVHDDNRTVLGLLDLVFGSVSPLQGVGRLDAYDFSADGTYLIGATQGSHRVGFLELSNLHPSDLRMDALPAGVFALANGAIFVDHGAAFGHATIIPSPTAKRAESFVLDGFLLTGIFDDEF